VLQNDFLNSASAVTDMNEPQGPDMSAHSKKQMMRPGTVPRSLNWQCAAALWRFLFISSALWLAPDLRTESKFQEKQSRYLTYEEVRETVAKYADTGLPGSTISTPHEWSEWIRAQDKDVRSRIDRGVEDSISNLVLFGTSFTKLPRLEGSEYAMDATTHKLSRTAIARVHDLATAAGATTHNERVTFVRELLKRKGVTTEQRENYLARNLVRYAEEQQEYHKKLEEAQKSGDKSEALAVRGTLYAKRGLSVDTSLLPNFAVEDTLRVLLTKGALKPNSVKRIAVIGPGLDFTDKRDGYDFYPLQTVQPFAVMEAVERLGLGKKGELQVVTMDLNAAVTSHVAKLAARAKQGRSYKLQLPRDVEAHWTEEAVNYWQHFGEVVGTPVTPLPVPPQLASVSLRAVAVAPERAARLIATDLNIVAQTADFADGERLDLVVATNILVYYDRFQQALAMTNIARMMNTGGMFVSNTLLPSAHDESLKYLGGRSVIYALDGSYGDDMVVYQKQ
jgi:hypothetical protein